MYGLHFLLNICGIKGIQDTQCGFKLFSRNAARKIWSNVHIERWAFDIEIIYLALQVFQITVAEVPVNWQEIEGSKLNPFTASVQIGIDILRIRANYMFSIWSIRDVK